LYIAAKIKYSDMKKTAIIYWPYKGATEKAAIKIHAALGKEKSEIFKLSEVDFSVFSNYDQFIIGGSTVGADNWQDAYKGEQWGPFSKSLNDNKVSLKGKKIALFGMGNQVLYPEHFVNDMKLLHDYFSSLDAAIIGSWPVEGYEHTDSKAISGGHFIGLALDEDTQPELTDSRIAGWLKQLEGEF